MRPLVTLLVVPALLLLGACSSGDDDTDPTSASSPTETTDPTPDPAPDEPDGDPGGPGDSLGTVTGPDDVCAEVNAGIAAFNAGDYDETVARFEAAVPLAEAAAEDDDSLAARQLLEAVEYYAELAPGDYPQASLTSPDFAEYKAITLGQCAASAPPPGETEPPGVLT